MEDSHYTELKNCLSSIPARALNYSCRKILSKSLDVKQLLSTKNGHARDYRGFAELMGLQYSDTKMFERYDEPTMKILEAWESHPDATLKNLIEFLEEMERYDVIEEINPILERDAEAFVQRQKRLAQETQLQEIPVQVPEVTSSPVSVGVEKQLLTANDVRTGACTIYDAYVSYADEDCGFVKKLSDFLESPEIGLKLFIRGRDMLAGSPELDTNIELIKNRCRQMLIILTNNFVHSKHCAFQVSFATSLSIEQREKKLVPVLISQCETPPILLRVSKIDFTKPDIYEWMWERLIMSLLPRDRNSLFLRSLEKFPETFMPTNMYVNPKAVVPEDNAPMITFPETTKQLALPLNKSPTIVSVEDTNNFSTEVVIEQHSSAEDSCSPELSCSKTEAPVISDNKDSSKEKKNESKSRSKKLKNVLRSYFTKDRLPSNSSSFSSGATSGYHSESTSLVDFKSENELSNKA